MNTKKQPIINGKVAGMGFVVLTMLLFIVPQILIYTAPDIFYSVTPLAEEKVPNPYPISAIIVAISFVIGVIVARKVKNYSIRNGIFTGALTVVTLIFFFATSHFASNTEIYLLMPLIIGLPVVAGAVVGAFSKK